MQHKTKPNKKKQCIVGRKNNGKWTSPNKRSKWEHSIHGGRCRSHDKLQKEKRSLYQNWATFNKTVPHTIWTNGTSIRNSAPTTPSERTGMNSGHSPRTTTQFLLRINKFAEANYVTVFTPDNVTIFDGDSLSSKGGETQQQGCGEYQ